MQLIVFNNKRKYRRECAKMVSPKWKVRIYSKIENGSTCEFLRSSLSLITCINLDKKLSNIFSTATYQNKVHTNSNDIITYNKPQVYFPNGERLRY